jgi:hypothetical protein
MGDDSISDVASTTPDPRAIQNYGTVVALGLAVRAGLEE